MLLAAMSNSNITYAHRNNSPANGYDNLNQLTSVEYLGNASDTESFNYDKLGNRLQAQLRGAGSAVTYGVNELTNRYDNSSGNPDILETYDNAGNRTVDFRGYHYSYDYENRLIKCMYPPGKVQNQTSKIFNLTKLIKYVGFCLALSNTLQA